MAFVGCGFAWLNTDSHKAKQICSFVSGSLQPILLKEFKVRYKAYYDQMNTPNSHLEGILSQGETAKIFMLSVAKDFAFEYGYFTEKQYQKYHILSRLD
jgi:hypothetical protein